MAVTPTLPQLLLTGLAFIVLAGRRWKDIRGTLYTFKFISGKRKLEALSFLYFLKDYPSLTLLIFIHALLLKVLSLLKSSI